MQGVNPAPVRATVQHPEMRRTSRRLSLVAVCLCFITLAGTLNLLTPSTPTGAVSRLDRGNVNPDERQHLSYVLAVADGRWPVLTRSTKDYESHQPPLYYALCSLFVHGQPPSTAMHTCRGVSTLLVLLTMLAAYAFLRRLLPRHPRIALATAAFVGLLPMNLSQAASVTNDTLLELVAAVVLLICGQIAATPQAASGRTLRVLFLGLILALGLWTKTNAVVLVAGALAVFAGLAGLRRVEPRQAAVEAGLLIATVVILAIPLYVRNTIVYGDPMATSIFRVYFHSDHIGLSSIPVAAQITFMSFWGCFDSMNLYYPGIVYLVLDAVVLVAAYGFWRAVRNRPISSLAVALWTVTVATVLLYVAFNRTYFQPQGRYLYTALVPLALGFIVGLRDVTPKGLRSIALACGVAGLLILDIYTVAMVVHRYN